MMGATAATLAGLVKLFLVPGSIGFLLLGLAAGLALLYAGKRGQRWGRVWLTSLAALYAVLSTPLGSNLLVSALARQHATVTSAAEAPGVDTIVVLSTGGEVYRSGDDEVSEMGRLTAFNAMEAARLFRLLGPRTTVIASGGIVNPGTRARTEADVLADALVRLGVPRAQVVLETRSRTTREQAVFSAEILRKRRVSRFLLVTSVDHMPRAHATFGAQSLQPIPSPSVPRLGGETVLDKLRPSVNALRQSEWALYEYLARAYYWGRGWTVTRGAPAPSAPREDDL